MIELPEEKRQQLLEAIYGGRKIETIKLVRKVSGCDLREAKDFVESMMAELQAKHPEKFQKRGGCSVAVFALIVIVGVVIGLLKKF